MIRFLMAVIFTVGAWLSFSAASFGQTGEPNTSPRPDGDNGWCTVVAGDDPNQDGCGYGSPEAACERQNSSFNPRGSLRFAGVRNVTAISATCDYDFTKAQTTEIPNYLAGVSKSCEFGYVVAGDICTPIEACTTCDPSQEVGNPINFISGQKKDVRIDFKSADGRFVIKRHYNSAPFAGAFRGNTNTISMTREFGQNWYLGEFPTLGADITHRVSGDYSNYLFTDSTGYGVGLTGYGDVQGGNAAGRLTASYRLEHPDGPVADDTTEDRTVSIIHKNGKKYNFVFPPTKGRALRDVTRKPVSVDFGEGYTQTFDYNADGSLASITDNYGRQATFEYNVTAWRVANGVENDIVVDDIPYDIVRYQSGGESVVRQAELGTLKRINFPDGTYTEYSYDSVDAYNAYWGKKERLLEATKFDPSGTEIHKEVYHYEDERIPYALTGVTDDAGIRFATWSYDEQGRANMSEHAGGVDRVDIVTNFENGVRSSSTREVTNALGHTKTYNVGTRSSTYSVSSMQGEGTADVKPTNETYRYIPGTGGLLSKEDPLSRQQSRTSNSRGLTLSKIYAEGTSEEFIATYEWHPRFNRPTQTVMPGLTTDYVYDDEGRIRSMLQTDTSANPAPPREWTYTWFGSNLASVNGPLPGAVDVTAFDHVNEKLIRVRNELGHETNITAHNAVGAPASFTDPNGVQTLLRYDARHRLTRIERAGAITEIGYTPTDLTSDITSPNGNRLAFAYNDGRQLIAIINGAGERVEYTRNAMGGILSTRIPDSSGTLQYSMTLARDEINRVIEATGVNSVTKFAYDEMNNLTEITDPRSNTWQQNYDNLDRLKGEIDPLGGTTDFDLDDQMDSRNPLSKVTDQRGVETVYVRNGYGEIIREVSFEAGTTEYLRDQAGRIIQMTDARGVVSTYSYDGMDRLLSVSYPAALTDYITYGYDQGPFGIGELTSITEDFGTTTYGYNALAQMVSMTRDINGVSYDTAYEFDLAGEVKAIIYPSGRRIEYSRDSVARETRIRMVAPDGTATILADNISYKPFGPIDGMELGDGHDLLINYDANYRATRLQRSGSAGSLMDLGFTYDEAGDITGLQDNLRPERSQTLGYDALSRLTDAAGGYGTLSYGYNPGGDRTARDWTQPNGNQKSERYTYDDTTARLSLVALEDTAGQFTPIRTFDYHASGQVSSDQRGPNAYLYGLNARGRLSTITRNGTQVAAYTHDESEQRIIKTADSKTLHYHYDLDGRLIAETDGTTGETLREYVWLGLMPIAVIDAGEEAPDTACEADIAALQALIDDRTTRIDNNAVAIARLFGLLTDKETRIAELADTITSLDALSEDKTARIAAHVARITELDALITDKQSRIDNHVARITELGDLIADKQSRIANNAERIDELTALIAVDEAELATLDPVLDAPRMTVLTDRMSFRTERVAFLTTRNGELAALITEHETRIAEMTARNAELAALMTDHETRTAELTTRNAELAELRDGHDMHVAELTTREAELAALITAHEERIDFLSDRNFTLAEQLAQFEADLIEAEADCDTGAVDGLYYLHADHLGRPQFATDPSGAVVWDMGAGVTPFGDSVNLAGAFAQRLMFPGQYADLETNADGDNVTLSHNWHRTYDPTLGRYLKSDPIGLAGGLNRFAYVGGNPLSMVDPEGLAEVFRPGFAFEVANQNAATTFKSAVKRKNVYAACFGVGSFFGGYAAGFYLETKNWFNIMANDAAAAGACETGSCSVRNNSSPAVTPLITPIVNTGDCRPDQHNRFQNAVESVCKPVRKCVSKDNAIQRGIKIGTASRCIGKRDRINNVCFKGGDRGHRESVRNLKRLIENCR